MFLSQPTTDKRASGKALRASVPRSSHATQPFKAAPRPDPITLLEKSNAGRARKFSTNSVRADASVSVYFS